MYGPGITQPPPRPAGRGAVVGMRVLFTALPVLSIGFLAWGSMLRLAIVRHKAQDWALMVVDIVAVVIGYTLVGLAHDNTDTWQSNVGTLTILACMLGTPAYFLVVDLRRKEVQPAGYAMPAGYGMPHPYATGYGPMGPAQAQVQGVIPGPAQAGHQAPAAGHTPYPHQAPPVQVQTPMPQQTPQPRQGPMPAQGPAPAQGAGSGGAQPPRISQVRAELDELSDYLRKEEGR
jgi:hypothetical protein